MSKLYQNGSKIGLRKVFNKWKDAQAEEARKLADANKGANKLRKLASKPTLKQFHKAIIHNGNFNKIKGALLNTLRNNDKNNLFFCFNKWKKVTNRLKEIEVK